MLGGASTFPKSCLPFSPIEPVVSHCLPTRVPVLDGASAFSTSCLPFLSPIVSPHGCLCWMGSCLACLCWTVRPSQGLVSPCLPTCVPACFGWCARLPEVLSPLVSPCTPSCFPLLDGVSAFPTVLSPPSPIVPLLVSLCWMVCPPSRGSCLPLSPIVPLIVSLCWMVRPPF